jgi:hypothetical protein
MNPEKKARLTRAGWTAGDRSVSIDLLVRSLLAIGADPGEIAKLIKRADSKRAAQVRAAAPPAQAAALGRTSRSMRARSSSSATARS